MSGIFILTLIYIEIVSSFLVLMVVLSKTFVKCEFNEGIFTDNLPQLKSERSDIDRSVVPIVKSDQLQNINAEALIEKVINNKIEELKPYLQDDDAITMDTENNLTLEGKDETTIIEFIPKNKDKKHGLRDKGEPFKNNVHKYKKVRDKIKRALNKESVSDKTHLLVMKTLDDLIAKLFGSQCGWKSGIENDTKVANLRPSHVISEIWNKHWKSLRNSYIKKIKPHNDSKQFNEIITFLDRLQTFFSFITKDVDTLAEHYKIKCMSMDKPVFRNHQNSFYDSESDLNRHNCQQFTICTKELKNFMKDFYNFLNDTAVSAVRNYAEMYLRDTDNDLEQQSIVKSINITSDIVEKNIIEIFVKQTKSLQLDENKNQISNIKALSKYVKSTLEEVWNNVTKILRDELSTVNEKKSSTIQADINVNLKVDMENLEHEVLGRICLVFKFCNGRYMGRRSGYHNVDINKENDIYVKVQLTLDDEMKKALKLKNIQRFLNINKNNWKQAIQISRTPLYKNIISFAIFNVTRTTPFLEKV